MTDIATGGDTHMSNEIALLQTCGNAKGHPVKRQPISRKTRFEIFKRDSFTCKYCGATPAVTELHVDHIHPVAEGGTNSPDNLLTACVDCNFGKGARILGDKSPPIEALSDAKKEQAEQIREWAKIQRDVLAAKQEVGEEVSELWEQICDTQCPRNLAGSGTRLAAEFGLSRLVEAMHIASNKSPRNQAPYFFGILKNWRAVGSPGVQSPTTPSQSIIDATARVKIEANFNYCKDKIKTQGVGDYWRTLNSVLTAALDSMMWVPAAVNGMCYGQPYKLQWDASDETFIYEPFEHGPFSFVVDKDDVFCSRIVFECPTMGVPEQAALGLVDKFTHQTLWFDSAPVETRAENHSECSIRSALGRDLCGQYLRTVTMWYRGLAGDTELLSARKHFGLWLPPEGIWEGL